MSLELDLQKRPIFSDQLNCASTYTKTLHTELFITTMLIYSLLKFKNELVHETYNSFRKFVHLLILQRKSSPAIFIYSTQKRFTLYLYKDSNISHCCCCLHVRRSVFVTDPSFHVFTTLFYLTNLLFTWQLFILILLDCTAFKNKDYYSRTTNW